MVTATETRPGTDPTQASEMVTPPASPADSPAAC